MASVQGTCTPAFAAVRAAFAENFASRGDVGAAVCVYLDGDPVVSLWAGYCDAARLRPWRSDTLACVASSGKGMAAVCALRLIERELIDLDAPVARYWPEFDQSGKGETRVRWLLSHRAGLPALRQDISTESMYEWFPLIRALEAEEPWWEPGTQHGYHALTFGFLVGELVRRVSGRSIGRYFREEIGLPLGADFHFGVAEQDDRRAADILAEPPPPPGEHSFWKELLQDPRSMSARAFLNPPRPPQSMNTRAWRAAEIPASNAYASAQGLARVYAALALDGKLDGVSVLAQATIRAAAVEQSNGLDPVIHAPSRFGLGFWLPTPAAPFGPSPRAFGHPGRGGSVGFADPDARIAFAYVPNQYQGISLTEPDPRAKALVDAVYASLEHRAS